MWSKPLTTTDVYGFTSRSISRRQVVELNARRSVLMSLGERRLNRFPSVPDRPLQHLSALDSTVYDRLDPIIAETLFRSQCSAYALGISGLRPAKDNRSRELCQTSECVAITYGRSVELGVGSSTSSSCRRSHAGDARGHEQHGEPHRVAAHAALM